MIKCLKCNSFKTCLKLNEKQYIIINECFNCYNRIHLFIDDYINNYKEFYCLLNKKETISELYSCSKHSKDYISFCNNCKELLCEECLISHDSINHLIQKIKEIVDNQEKNEINEYKNELINLKTVIEKKIGEIDNIKNVLSDKIKILRTLLNVIKIKNIFLDMNIWDDKINAYDLISLKFLINKYNKVKINLLITSIKTDIFPSEKVINEYKKSIFFSFKSIPREKIINKNIHNWVNHIIQLQNGNILCASWETFFLYKINKQKNSLEQIKSIRINNGSINHMYEYKKNKILCCDNQMKILQLNEDNTSYKILCIADYGRKIIPYFPNINQINIDNCYKFLFTATPNGIKLYYYLDNILNDLNYEQIEEDVVDNDINFIGDFSNGYDYSSIIEVKNKICGIYHKDRYDSTNNFAVWEINYDFNIDNFSKDKFNLLGEIKNVGAGIGRYSITKVNDEYVLIGVNGNNYYYNMDKERKNNGIKVVSLKSIEIIQYIYNSDEIMCITCIKNGMILTGGVNIIERKYFIRHYRYDDKDKEICLVDSIQLHNDFINYIDELKDGIFMSCGRDGNIYLIYS